MVPTELDSPPRRALEDAYIITASANDGRRGMFATRDILAGQVVLVERPAIVFPRAIPNFPINGKSSFEAVFDQLDGPTKAEALKLHNCKPKEVCDLHEGIIRTNGLGVDLAPSSKEATSFTKHTGIFLKMSMINHRYVKLFASEPNKPH